MLRLIEHEKAVVEGGGAAGLAALLPGGPLDVPELKGKTVTYPHPPLPFHCARSRLLCPSHALFRSLSLRRSVACSHHLTLRV